jgi:hypothetical protein
MFSEIEAAPNDTDKNVKDPDIRHATAAGHSIVNAAPQSRSESSRSLLSKAETQTRARVDGAAAASISRAPVLNEGSKLPDPFTVRDAQPIIPSVSTTPRNEEPNDTSTALRPAQEPSSPDRESASRRLSALLRHEDIDERSMLVHSSKASAELAAQMREAAAAMGAIHGAARREDASRSAQSSAAESDSSVHVTIGKIEVRAVTENNRVSRPHAASPVMRLEEYLQQRAQRGGL